MDLAWKREDSQPAESSRITGLITHTARSLHLVSRVLSPHLPFPSLEMDWTSLFLSLVPFSRLYNARKYAILRDLWDTIGSHCQGCMLLVLKWAGYFFEQTHSKQSKGGEVIVRLEAWDPPLRAREPVSDLKQHRKKLPPWALCFNRRGRGLHFPTHPPPSHSKVRIYIVFNFRLILRAIIF